MAIGTVYTQQEPYPGFGNVPFGNPDTEDKEFRRGFGDATTNFLEYVDD